MSHIKIEDLKDFCKKALIKEGMKEEFAAIVAEVLSETDAWGTKSHGSKNLHGYIQKSRVGGIDIKAEPELLVDTPSLALMDAKKAMGMIPGYLGMELACEKAAKTGIALVATRNSCHFGAAGYYANMAAKKGFIGLAMSNVDPNMTAPGARGQVLGNNPFAYAAPSNTVPSVFLDIAMSNVASMKVIQAMKDGVQIPDTWIVDKDGLPTTDPTHYSDGCAMQPMAAHKGYGLSIMVELLTGILAGGCTSMGGEIVSWCFELDKPNNVCQTFIAIDPKIFLGKEAVADRVETMAGQLRNAPKAKNSTRIFTPGEIEWGKHAAAQANGIDLAEDVEASIKGLSDESGIALKLF